MENKFDPTLVSTLQKLKVQNGDLIHLPDERNPEVLRQIMVVIKYLVGPNIRVAIVGGDIKKLDLLDMNAAGWYNCEQMVKNLFKSELYEEVWNKAKSLGFANVTMALAELEKLTVNK